MVAHDARARASVPMSLAVRDVAVSFGGVAALAGVSFEIQPHTVTSLIGPNGAGKTTLFNAITGYLRPGRGHVAYEGRTLTGLRPSDVAQRGVVRTFQKTSVFPALSVIDNVMIGLHLRGSSGWAGILAGRRRVRDEESRLRADAGALIAFVGLTARGRETAGALPYGDQRLVEVAIALGARPSALLLDEPAAGMTGSEKDTVSRLILNIRAQGVTVFLVEHDMRLVMGISDRVLVLNHGRLIADGAPAEIQAHPDVIRAYLGAGSAPA
jgi:branched-chain amino acid transport system ATP-binding protein